MYRQDIDRAPGKHFPRLAFSTTTTGWDQWGPLKKSGIPEPDSKTQTDTEK